MSWMDDGGFDMQTFTAQDGRPMARMSFRTSTSQYYFNFTKTEVQRVRRECNRILKEMGGNQMTSHDSKPEVRKPNYTLRRLKFAAAIIGFVSSMTLLFTWRTADSQSATILVSVIYILTVLWLTVRFAPRE